jgi:hypothetical protein
VTGRHKAGAVHRAIDWTFVNRRTGGITVAQWPNVPLSIFIVATLVLRLLHPSGGAHTAARVVADASILLWALDEVGRGVNPFRRMLGVVVACAVIAGLTLH